MYLTSKLPFIALVSSLIFAACEREEGTSLPGGMHYEEDFCRDDVNWVLDTWGEEVLTEQGSFIQKTDGTYIEKKCTYQ
jgi:hypothetical protein